VLAPLADRYDLVVLDCPPSVSLVSENVFDAADALLVPVIPTTLSVRTFEQLRALLAANGRSGPGRGTAGGHGSPAVLAFFSMADRRKTLHREVMARYADDPEVLPVDVPASSAVEQMGTHRAPVATFAPRRQAALAFRRIWEELAARLW
jgi:cellulose biosynthesis protein BcsQ